MGNTAANMGFIVWVIIAVVFMVISWLAVLKPAISLIAAYRKGEASGAGRRAVIIAAWAIVLTVAVVIFLVGYGPGEQTTPAPPETEERFQLNRAMPDEKPKEALEQEAEAKRPESLKRVREPGFEKERQEADDYIKEALDRAERRREK